LKFQKLNFKFLCLVPFLNFLIPKTFFFLSVLFTTGADGQSIWNATENWHQWQGDK
jgi:hypothetical protein